MPSPEELNRIQEENLTNEQIEQDKIREEAYEAGGEKVKNKIKKIEFLSKELKDKGIEKNDLVRVWLSAKHWKGGPDGAYGTFTRGYLNLLTEEYLEIYGYTLGNRKVEEKINIEDIEKIDKEKK